MPRTGKRPVYDADKHAKLLDEWASNKLKLAKLSAITRENTRAYNKVLMCRTMALRRARTHQLQPVYPTRDPVVMAARAVWVQRKDAINARVAILTKRRRELAAELKVMNNAALTSSRWAYAPR